MALSVCPGFSSIPPGPSAQLGTSVPCPAPRSPFRAMGEWPRLPPRPSCQSHSAGRPPGLPGVGGAACTCMCGACMGAMLHVSGVWFWCACVSYACVLCVSCAGCGWVSRVCCACYVRVWGGRVTQVELLGGPWARTRPRRPSGTLFLRTILPPFRAWPSLSNRGMVRRPKTSGIL